MSTLVVLALVGIVSRWLTLALVARYAPEQLTD